MHLALLGHKEKLNLKLDDDDENGILNSVCQILSLKIVDFISIFAA